MIKYIGSKRLLITDILAAVSLVEDVRSVIDLFSGTARVSHALKKDGYRVLANDCNSYAATLARCYVEADRAIYESEAKRWMAELQRIDPKPGWFTETYCEKSRYFQPHNGAKIEAIREAISSAALDPLLEAILLTSLLEAADRVDSTVAVQMAYLKKWSSRSYNDLSLRLPEILNQSPHGPGEVYQLDAVDAASVLSADVSYLDPPYNQHNYLGNYHVWETLILWDRPEVYGIACKRVDVKTRKSPFNSRVHCVSTMRSLIERIQARVLIVSFSNEGFISREEMEDMLAIRGHIQVVERDYKRYVGAQIGVHNQSGIKVGTTSHLRNKEYIYIAGDRQRKVTVGPGS